MDTGIVEVSRMIIFEMQSDSSDHLYKSAKITTGYIYHVLQILDKLVFSYYRKAEDVKREAQSIYKRLNVDVINIPDNGETIYEILIIAEQISYDEYLAAVEEKYCKENESVLSIIHEAKFFTRMYKYRLGLKDQDIPRKLRRHKQTIFIFEYKYLFDFCDMANCFLARGKVDIAIDALRTLMRLIWFYSPYIQRSPGSELVRLNYRGYWVDLNLDYIFECGIEIAKRDAITSNHDQALRSEAEVIILCLTEAREQI